MSDLSDQLDNGDLPGSQDKQVSLEQSELQDLLVHVVSQVLLEVRERPVSLEFQDL